ncbi:hypothetical protein FOL47_000240 [Perkinsus chesapeaki]|uniref:Uncharacterized protein n=1 Tax=Perkinsus chesapeaki TaxID=330153 RepID=A0A7J6MMR1_PERCH|nr:hypothetical protein FOL47_000240 [Perkinsus chesapeaki]
MTAMVSHVRHFLISVVTSLVCLPHGSLQYPQGTYITQDTDWVITGSLSFHKGESLFDIDVEMVLRNFIGNEVDCDVVADNVPYSMGPSNVILITMTPDLEESLRPCYPVVKKGDFKNMTFDPQKDAVVYDYRDVMEAYFLKK